MKKVAKGKAGYPTKSHPAQTLIETTACKEQNWQYPTEFSIPLSIPPLQAYPCNNYGGCMKKAYTAISDGESEFNTILSDIENALCRTADLDCAFEVIMCFTETKRQMKNRDISSLLWVMDKYRADFRELLSVMEQISGAVESFRKTNFDLADKADNVSFHAKMLDYAFNAMISFAGLKETLSGYDREYFEWQIDLYKAEFKKIPAALQEIESALTVEKSHPTLRLIPLSLSLSSPSSSFLATW